MIGIIDFIIDLAIILFLLRLALESRQFYFNPMLQPVHKATEAVMTPLRQVFRPTKSGFDYTPLIAIVLLVILRAGILFLVTQSVFTGCLMVSSIKFIDFIFQVYIVMLVISVIIERTSINPLGRFIFQMVSMVVKPFEKLPFRLGTWVVIPVFVLLVIVHTGFL